MLTPEQIEECARAASKHSATLGKGDVLAWMTRGEYLRLARAVEAATLATVTPLVQQMLDALENGKRVRECDGGTEYQPPLEDSAITAARAFLSGATKESTDHGQ